MKNIYTVTVLAAMLCANGAAIAQSTSVSEADAARAAVIALKAAGPTSSDYTPPGARGSMDECSGAISLTVGTSCVTVNGDLASATESMPPITCNGFLNANANDHWYSFTATSAITNVEVTGGPDIDPVVEAFSGSCGSLTSVGCADATLVNETELVQIATTVGMTYYVRTYWWDYGTAPTDFSFTICAYQAGAGPANDLCADVAIENLTVGTPLTLTGTTASATVINDYAPGSLLDGSPGSVWHAFTTTECISLEISYCGTTPAFGNAWIVIATECPANDLIFNSSWNTTDCTDGNVTIYYDSLAAGTYYLPVMLDVGLANGPYTIELTATATPGDCVVGVGEVAADGLVWSIYPNPGNGDITVQWNGQAGRVTMELVDLRGRAVYQEAVAMTNGMQHQIPMAGQLTPGAYSLRVSSAQGTSEQRVIIR